MVYNIIIYIGTRTSVLGIGNSIASAGTSIRYTYKLYTYIRHTYIYIHKVVPVYTYDVVVLHAI